MEHKARQTQGNGGPRPPKRPGYGTVGRPIQLRENVFQLNISPNLSDLHHYDVSLSSKKKCCEIIWKYKDTTFQGHQPAFDGEKNLYSRIKLPPAELSVTLPGEDGGRDRAFKAQEVVQASSKYLREEFKTSISPEMVKVDGRVIPAPRNQAWKTRPSTGSS
ncbi:Protein argonaute-3 [Desmophyllum pertusum]|uniref:Protein argonaute-3 n=1 Tax=Desmophyllum pertusum TaxID=174260 RepID=A0A9W9ZXE3_9CNID|nr:Protein argonaute-3 [Desmophyllum pertusum]